MSHPHAAVALLLGLLAIVPPPTLAAAAAAGPDAADAADTTEPPHGEASILEADLRAHVGFLAADGMRGRDTGEPGSARAEEYIAQTFQRLGLLPYPGRDDPFVPFELYREAFDPAGTYLRAEADPGRTCRPGVDCRPFSFSDEGVVRAGVVFAGYGITAPDLEWDDYAGLDVEGRIALILRHEPGEDDPDSRFDGTSSTAHAQFTAKARNAQRHGAAGMILVTDPLNHPAGDDLRLGGRLSRTPPAGSDRGEEDDAPFLAIQVARPFARALLGGADLAELQRAVDGGRTPAQLGATGAGVELAVRRRPGGDRVQARDVVGVLRGADPALAGEWIVVGAHHDHIGAYEGPGDTVFNGADDNASGVAGLLELAQAFATTPQRPARTIVFVTFSAEEKGLLGSSALVDRDDFPLDRVAFMFNLDMIGRNPERAIEVQGDGYARGLRAIVEAANAARGLKLEFGGAAYAGNSDHHAFYMQDIPFAFFFTGLHEDYHRVGDHADKLDYPRMERLVRLAYDVLGRLAAADMPRLSFVHRIAWLGLQVEVRPDGRAAEIIGVDAGSKAEEAGFAKGDLLLTFDGSKLTDPRSVGRAFRAIDPGDTTTIEVRGPRGRRAIDARRAEIGYMGVFPSSVDPGLRAEWNLPDDEGVVLRSVVPDGPSYRGGLREGDVVLRMDGLPLNVDNLRARLSQIGAGETVTLLVLRDGARKELRVTLGSRPER